MAEQALHMREQAFRGTKNRLRSVVESRDEGFLLLGVSAKLAKIALVVAVGAGMGAWNDARNSVKVTTEADLEGAHTETHIAVTKFELSGKLETTTIEYEPVVTAENIEYKIDSEPIDVIPNPRVNKQLTGEVHGDIAIPLEAITQTVNSATNKVDMTVDAADFETTLYYPGAGAEIQNYTIDDGEKNFEDPSGFRDSWLRSRGAKLEVIGIDRLTKWYNNIDGAVEDALKENGLSTFGQECGPKVDAQAREHAKQVIQKAVATLGRIGDLGTVTITPAEIKWPDYTITVEGKEKDKEFIVGGGYKNDVQSCEVSDEVLYGIKEEARPQTGAQ